MKEQIKSFIEGINVFGYRFVKEEDYKEAYNNSAERLKLVNERNTLREDNVTLKSEVESLKAGEQKLPFDITIGDPTPQKASERKVYVAEVAGFHKTHLHDKLMYMIHYMHTLFEDEGNRRDQDLMLKGAIYAFREINRWGDMMISERMSHETDGESLEEYNKK